MATGQTDKRTIFLKLSVFACVFAGSFQYGYNISSANGPATFIKDTFYPLSFQKGVYDNGQLVENCTSVDECAPCQASNCTWGFDPSKQAEIDLEIASRGNHLFHRLANKCFRKQICLPSRNFRRRWHYRLISGQDTNHKVWPKGLSSQGSLNLALVVIFRYNYAPQVIKTL